MRRTWPTSSKEIRIVNEMEYMYIFVDLQPHSIFTESVEVQEGAREQSEPCCSTDRRGEIFHPDRSVKWHIILTVPVNLLLVMFQTSCYSVYFCKPGWCWFFSCFMVSTLLTVVCFLHFSQTTILLHPPFLWCLLVYFVVNIFRADCAQMHFQLPSFKILQR